jgi:hypothetical protein
MLKKNAWITVVRPGLAFMIRRFGGQQQEANGKALII